MSDVLGFHRRPSSGRWDISKEWFKDRSNDHLAGGLGQQSANWSRGEGEPRLGLALTIAIAGSAVMYWLAWIVMSSIFG